MLLAAVWLPGARVMASPWLFFALIPISFAYHCRIEAIHRDAQAATASGSPL